MSSTATKEWLSARAAALLLGTTVYQLMKRAANGEIRTLADPGCPIKFLAEDIERLRPASSD